MNDVKLIQRFAVFQKGVTTGAGVYNGATIVTVTVGPFQIILNHLTAGLKSHDTGTGQGIQSAMAVDVSLSPFRDNPAMSSSNLATTFMAGIGVDLSYDLYMILNPSEVFTVQANIYLNAVTANNISNQFSFVLGYLCPEDFLNVERPLVMH